MNTILEQDEESYLCRRVDTTSGRLVVVPNEYMLVPKAHIVGDPPVWLYGQTAMLKKHGITADNQTANLTSVGGRTCDHAHIHFIVRTDGRRLGLNGMIALATRLEHEVRELRATVADLRRELADARRRSGVQLNGN